MSPATRGRKTRGTTAKRTVTATSRANVPVPTRVARVVLHRINPPEPAGSRRSSRRRPEESEAVAEDAMEMDQGEGTAQQTPTLSQGVRGRPRRSTTVARMAAGSEPGPVLEPTIPDLIPIVDTHEAPIVPTTSPEAQPTPTPAEGVAVVDLTTPRATVPTRPVEVDLTCELDDEVFVVLEDIVNPSRRSTVLPLALGASPPRSRIAPPMRFRRTYVPPSDNTIVLDQTLEEEIEKYVGGTQDQPSTSSAGIQSDQDTSERIQCPICLDTLSQIKRANNQFHSTICGHLFCGPCIRRAVETTKQCPTCRRSLDLRKIHPIFI